MQAHKRLAGRAGFTLIEVLISIMLLVVISMAIYQATTSTFRLRDSLMTEGDFGNSIRLSMSILERDVAQLYSPTLQKRPQPSPTPGSAPQAQTFGAREESATRFWSAPLDATGMRAMRFIGKEDSMSFVATANLRVQRDSPESEFLKVVYELREDTEKDESGKSNEKRGRMLVRVTHPNAFSTEESREDRSQRTYPLLRGIQKLRFRYFRRDRDNGWSTTWDSDSADMKDRYPDLIETTLEVSAPPRLSFEGLFKFGPEAPLNGLDQTL